MSISTTADLGRNGLCTSDVINIKQDTLENSSEGDSIAEHKLLEDSLGFKNGLGAELHGIAGKNCLGSGAFITPEELGKS